MATNSPGANIERSYPSKEFYPEGIFFFKAGGLVLPLEDDDPKQRLEHVPGEIYEPRGEELEQIEALSIKGYPLLLAVHAICNAHLLPDQLPHRDCPTMLMATVGVPSVGKSAFSLFLGETFAIPTLNMDPFSNSSNVDAYRALNLRADDIYSARKNNTGSSPSDTLHTCLDKALAQVIASPSIHLFNLDCPGLIPEGDFSRSPDEFDLLRGATEVDFWILAGSTPHPEHLEIVARSNRFHFTYCPGPAFSNGEFNGNLRAENFDFLTSELSNRLPNVFKRV